MKIDTRFDFRSDARNRDPDSSSPTLKAYQRYLYNKLLPCGDRMDMDENLAWREFLFSSDSMLNGFTHWPNYQHIIAKVDRAVIERYLAGSSFIGGKIIFPCNKIPGTQTINQTRGCSTKIRDRFDLTLECIRRYYCGESSPLSKCFDGYKSFFDLFVDFHGYVDFFHLQDLVSSDYASIQYFCWHDNFESCFPLPRTVEEYVDYIDRILTFSESRSKRIDKWCEETRTP